MFDLVHKESASAGMTGAAGAAPGSGNETTEQ
jgi:hypothetical protein